MHKNNNSGVYRSFMCFVEKYTHFVFDSSNMRQQSWDSLGMFTTVLHHIVF